MALPLPTTPACGGRGASAEPWSKGAGREAQ